MCSEKTEQVEGVWNVLEDQFVSIDGCVMSCCSPQANKVCFNNKTILIIVVRLMKIRA